MCLQAAVRALCGLWWQQVRKAGSGTPFLRGTRVAEYILHVEEGVNARPDSTSTRARRLIVQLPQI